MIYNYFILGLFFAMTFVFGMGVGVTIALIQTAHAQTPTTINPESVNPTSGLKFLEQKAYVYTIPPLEVQVQQQQQQPTDLNSIIPALVASAGSFIAGKIASDKKTAKVADTVQEIVIPEQVKQNEKTKELARVTYDMNPEKAAEIKDAPAVKIATLTEDASKFAETAAKTSLS